MAESNKIVTLHKLGERVKILHAKGVTGKIVELRGPLGPNGMQIYRVRLRKKPTPDYVEVREDQLETVAAAE